MPLPHHQYTHLRLLAAVEPDEVDTHGRPDELHTGSSIRQQVRRDLPSALAFMLAPSSGNPSRLHQPAKPTHLLAHVTDVPGLDYLRRGTHKNYVKGPVEHASKGKGLDSNAS